MSGVVYPDFGRRRRWAEDPAQVEGGSLAGNDCRSASSTASRSENSSDTSSEGVGSFDCSTIASPPPLTMGNPSRSEDHRSLRRELPRNAHRKLKLCSREMHGLGIVVVANGGVLPELVEDVSAALAEHDGALIAWSRTSGPGRVTRKRVRISRSRSTRRARHVRLIRSRGVGLGTCGHTARSADALVQHQLDRP